MNIQDIVTRGVVNIIPGKEELTKLLESGKKLNVYLGVDPTAPRMHIGHAVHIRKLKALVELGHNVTFLVGDFTTRIGDASDKDKERPILTVEQIEENIKTYQRQASKILDFSNVNIVYNSEWLKTLTFADVVQLTQHFSVGDFISRELIKKRLAEGGRVRLDETLYPIMQGYDSYHLDTDIQLGGADQTFNMQAGRTLQTDLRNKESFVLVSDYLEGTDGRKMSKSWGNAIWLEDEPNEMYGKVMSLRDDLIGKYFYLATSLSDVEIDDKVQILEDGANPMPIKHGLAYQIVKELHSEKAAQNAQEEWKRTFTEKVPEYNQEVQNQGTLLKTLAALDGMSTSEVKRLVGQKAVDVNGETVTDINLELKGGEKVKVGKKIFVKVV